MNRISITGLGLLVAMAVGTSSVMADGSLLTPALLGQDGGGMSGWLEAGWSYSDDGVAGRAHDRGNNDVGVAQIGVDYDNGAGGDSAVGYHVTFVYGSDGLGGNGNGNDFNLTNANIQWVLPAGVPGLTGAKLTVGRFESPLGGESIYSGGDHVTRGLVSTITDPIAHTGILAEKALVSGADGDVVSARLGLVNSSTTTSWNNDADDSPSWIVGIDYAGLAGIDISANVLHNAGTEDDTLYDIGVSMDVPGALSDVVSLLGDTSISGHLVFGENDSFGFSTGGRYDFGLPVLGDDGSTKNWYLAVRYDNYDGGSGVGNEWGLTTTLGYQAADNLTMRIEYRWDRADTGLGGDGTDDEQTGLNINLVTSF